MQCLTSKLKFLHHSNIVIRKKNFLTRTRPICVHNRVVFGPKSDQFLLVDSVWYVGFCRACILEVLAFNWLKSQTLQLYTEVGTRLDCSIFRQMIYDGGIRASISFKPFSPTSERLFFDSKLFALESTTEPRFQTQLLDTCFCFVAFPWTDFSSTRLEIG